MDSTARSWAPVDGVWEHELRTLISEWPAHGVGAELEHSEAQSPQPPEPPGVPGDEEPLRSLRERLRDARPAEGVAAGRISWSRLLAAAPVDALDSLGALGEEERPLSKSRARRRRGTKVEVSSGGQVFFGLLAPPPGLEQEEAVAIKFCNARHRRQSEQMAAELAWRLNAGAPESTLLLRVHDQEWQELKAAAAPLCERLGDLLTTKQSLLLMQFVPGEDLEEERAAWETANLAASAESLGRLLVLDMLLGNADRLPIGSLAWRGNPSNVLWSHAACVPIDALVARRPPKMLVADEDQRVGKVLELVLLDAASAQGVLLEAVSCNATAVAAVEHDWDVRERFRAAAKTGNSSAPAPVDAVKAFHTGVRSALDLALREQGLLEMVVGALRSWFDDFHAELAPVAGKADWRSRTMELKGWSKEADSNEQLKERWVAWQERMQAQSLELWEAAMAWAKQCGVEAALSFKGFLGETVVNPIMDAYELLVRLEHLLARCKVMAAAAQVTRPCDLAPSPLLTGSVTAAACFHLLRKLGVTAILNCTADVPAPTEAELGGIRWQRLALEDTEDQELAIEDGLRFIQEQDGGRVLLHCHEGRSRSVSMALAYLVSVERQPLAQALAFVKARNARARPNAGFWKQLMALELRKLGSSTAAEVPDGGARGSKPKGLVCAVCGETVGLSEEALAAHMRHKHKEEGPEGA